MHQHIDDDLELPMPGWIQRTAHELDKYVAEGHTSLKQVRQAVEFLGMIEADDFCCPIPEINFATGRITFVWPATKGGLIVTVQDELGQCVIDYPNDLGLKIRKKGGLSFLRHELTAIYPFLRWRWERNTLL